MPTTVNQPPAPVGEAIAGVLAALDDRAGRIAIVGARGSGRAAAVNHVFDAWRAPGQAVVRLASAPSIDQLATELARTIHLDTSPTDLDQLLSWTALLERRFVLTSNAEVPAADIDAWDRLASALRRSSTARDTRVQILARHHLRDARSLEHRGWRVIRIRPMTRTEAIEYLAQFRTLGASGVDPALATRWHAHSRGLIERLDRIRTRHGVGRESD